MSAVPRCVEDLQGKHVTSLSCGAKHSIALTESGDVYTWGWNFNGQLGYDYKDEFRPRLLKPLLLIKALQQKRVASVATGAISSAALMQSGEVYTWGGNTDHQLGQGDDRNQATLRLVLRLHNYRITKVACGGGHVLALTSSGSVFSWGRNNNGRLGHGHSQPVSMPEKVKALQGAFITKVACGWSHSLCYSERDGGRLWTWGVGKDGRLGHGDNSDRSTPTEVQALHGVALAHISGGYYHSAAVTDEGRVYTWGWGEHGQLGHGTLDSELTPRRVGALANVDMVGVECGGFHSMGYDDQGRCWVFGLGEHGQLGILEESARTEPSSEDGTTPEDTGPRAEGAGALEMTPPEKRSLPTIVESLRGKRVVFVAAGLWHSMAIVVAGQPCRHPPASFANFTSELQLLDSQLSPQASARMKSASFGCLPYQGEEEALVGRGAQLRISGGDEDTDSDESEYYDDEEEEEEEYGEEELSSAPLPTQTQTRLRADEALVMSPSPDQGLIGKLTTWIRPINYTDPVVKEKKVEQQAQHWERHILPQWSKLRNTPRVRALWKKGIPPTVRGKVWPLAIPNFLALTPGQYASLREAGQAARTKRLEATRKAGMEEQPGLIELDLPRTFPKLSLFNEEGPFYQQLWDILETYSIFRPEIGYVQGMSFLAAMFLLYMDEFTSFRCLANMLEFPFFRALYKMDIAHILRFVRVYELLFAQQMPELFDEFTRKNISPEHYLLDWLFTLFSRALPFDIVGRLWDRYFLEGEVFLFRAALAILKISYPRLRGNSFEEICLLLRQLPQDMDEAMLFEAIHTITVPDYCKRFIQRLRAEDERSIEIQMESVADDSELSLGQDDTTATTLDRPPQGQQPAPPPDQ